MYFDEWIFMIIFCNMLPSENEFNLFSTMKKYQNEQGQYTCVLMIGYLTPHIPSWSRCQNFSLRFPMKQMILFKLLHLILSTWGTCGQTSAIKSYAVGLRMNWGWHWDWEMRYSEHSIQRQEDNVAHFLEFHNTYEFTGLHINYNKIYFQ